MAYVVVRVVLEAVANGAILADQSGPHAPVAGGELPGTLSPRPQGALEARQTETRGGGSRSGDGYGRPKKAGLPPSVGVGPLSRQNALFFRRDQQLGDRSQV